MMLLRLLQWVTGYKEETYPDRFGPPEKVEVYEAKISNGYKSLYYKCSNCGQTIAIIFFSSYFMQEDTHTCPICHNSNIVYAPEHIDTTPGWRDKEDIERNIRLKKLTYKY